MNLKSSDGASNLTITQDDSNGDRIDENHSSSDEVNGKNNQSEVEKSRISWFPGGLHELNNQIMSEITDAGSNAETEASYVLPKEENDSDEDESVDIDLDDQVVNKTNLEDEEEEEEGTFRTLESRGDLDDGLSDDDDNTEEDEKDTESPRNGQRGGALVKEAKKRLPFLEPLETGKVASAASRLLNDDAGEGNGEPSSEVFAQEIPVETDQHVNLMMKNSKDADNAAESEKVESLFNIELDQGTVGLNISNNEIEDITAAKVISSSTVSNSLEGQQASHSVVSFRGVCFETN